MLCSVVICCMGCYMVFCVIFLCYWVFCGIFLCYWVLCGTNWWTVVFSGVMWCYMVLWGGMWCFMGVLVLHIDMWCFVVPCGLWGCYWYYIWCFICCHLVLYMLLCGDIHVVVLYTRISGDLWAPWKFWPLRGACSLCSHGFLLRSKSNSGKSGFLITNTWELFNGTCRFLDSLYTWKGRGQKLLILSGSDVAKLSLNSTQLNFNST